MKARLALAAAASLAVSTIYTTDAQARGIRGAKVTAGSAAIRHKGPNTTIRAADRTIIRYDRFNVGAKESVRFVQPSKNARVLNRISGASPSRIDGRLSANGIVYFVNPAGVMFGKGSVLNVGGLYAAAGGMRDEDFLNGVNRFQLSSGRVENRGTIFGGAIHLTGGDVVNTGTIVADNEVVTLASGSEVFLAEKDSSILVRVESSEAPAAGGTVANSGDIRAGSVQMIGGSGVGDIYSIAVRNSGRIKAREITIDAKDGMAQVSGKLDASSIAPGEKGGTVQVLGDKVALNSASIDASGKAGGGTVLVGGDFQGKGQTPTASRTFVSADSTITADATANGDGGKVIVWSDQATGFAGKISAKGGSEGGDGGFAEVSGKETLAFRGQVDLSAPAGTQGTLLLDPRDIRIVDANGGADDGELGDDEILFDDDDPPDNADQTDFTISETVLEGINGTIILQALQDVIIEDLATDGNLNLALVNAGESLVIQAGRHITFLDTTNTITTAGGAVHLEADSPHATSLSPLGTGSLTLGNITTGGGDVTLIGDGFDIAGLISAGAGNIAVGRAEDGLQLRIGTATNPHLTDAEIDNLQTTGILTLGQVTTAGDDGIGGATAQQVTSGLIQIGGTTFGSRNVALVTDGTIDDPDDSGNAITTTGSLTLTSGAAIGGAGGTQGLNTNIDSLTVVSTGGNNITLTNDGTQPLELTSVETGGAGNILITQAAGNITIPDNGVVTTGSVTIAATGGSINAVAGSDNNGTPEVSGTGGVTLSATGIGDASQLEISGDNALVVNSAGTAEVDIEVITTPFDSITITQEDRRADIRISLPGTDLVDIDGTVTSATEGTTNNVVLFEVDAGTGVDFDYALLDPLGNVLVKSGNVFARGELTVSSSGDLTLGDIAGVAIQADPDQNVALGADGAIISNGGTIAMSGGRLTLNAGTAVGAALAPIATTGSHELAAQASAGGVFITNSASGTVTVAGTGVSGVGADIELRNSVGALNIAAGGVTTDGAGNIVIEGAGVSHTGGAISAVNGTILIDGNDGDVTTGTITTSAAGNAIRVIDTGALAVQGPMSAANGTVVLGEGGAGDRINGDITQNATGIITANTLTIDSASGNIDLNGVLNAIATLGAVSRNGRLRFLDDGGLTIAAPLTAVTLTNEVDIETQNGPLLINGDISTIGANNISLAGEGLTLGAGITINAGAGVISLDGGGGAISLGAGTLTTTNNTAAAITVRDATDVILGATTASGGGLVLGAAQDITGDVAQAPATAINVISVTASTDGAIFLDSAANAINSVDSITRGGALTIRDAGGGLTLTGTVTGGTITNTVDIETTGGALDILGDVSTSGANNVRLAGVGVTQSASTIDGGAGQVLIDGRGGAIDLGSGTITTTNAGTSAVTVRNAMTVALGNITAPSGTLVLGLAQDILGNVTQNPLTLIDANVVTASTAAAISLNSATNAINSLGSITRGGALTVRDSADGLTIAAPITTGTTTNAVDISTGGGPLAINADVTGDAVTLRGQGLAQSAASTVTASAAALLDGDGGAIDLDGSVAISALGGTITIRDGGVTSVGALNAPDGTINIGVARDITGSLTQTGPILGSALNVSTAGAVALNHPANDVLTLTGESFGDFSYTDASDVAALGIDSSNGDVDLTALTGLLTVLTLDAGTGDTQLTADDMNFIGGAGTITGTGDITLRPTSPARDINIGTGAAGGLALTDVDLAALQDGFNLITIGRALDGTGAVTVSSITFTDDVSIVGGTIVLGLIDAGANDVTLAARTGGIIDSSGSGGANIIAQTVNMSAVTGIGAAGALGRIGLDASDASAINTTSGGIFLDGLSAAGITFTQIDAQAAGNVELTSVAGATLTAVDAAGGTVSASAADLLHAVLVASNANVNLAGGDVVIDNTLAQVDLNVSSAGSIIATNAEALTGNATLNAGTSIDAGFVGAAGTASLTSTNGNIVGIAGDAAADVVAPNIALTVLNSGTIGTAGADLEVDATTLSASTNNGDIFITDTAGGVAAGLISAGLADVSLTSAGGSLTSASVDGVADVRGSTISVATTGAGDTIGAGSLAPLEIDAAVLNASTVDADILLHDTAGGLAAGLIDAGAGDVELTVSGGDLTSSAVDGAADVIGARVALTLPGAGDQIGVSEADGLEVDTSTLEARTIDGNIFIRGVGGNVAVRHVDAGAGDVALIAADAGSITSEAVDGVADVIGDHVTVRTLVEGTIGASGAAPLELNANTLTASATSAGASSIFLLDTAAGVAVDSITADEVELTAGGGSITSLAVDAAPDIVGNDITLSVTGAGSRIGTDPLNPLEIDAVTLTATTGGGAADHIFILDTAAGVAVDSVNAGAGDVELIAQGGGITSAAAGPGAVVTGDRVNLLVAGAGGIGTDAANPLRIDANVLNADTTAVNGDIFITDTQGGVAIRLVDAGTGDIVLRAAGGGIVSQNVDGVADVLGARVELSVNGAGAQIGTAPGSRLEIDATELHASSADGSIFIADTAGGVVAGSIDAGAQDVHLSATAGSILDDANDVTTIAGGDLFLNVDATHGIGELAGAGSIDTSADSLTAAAGTGGVFVSENSGLRVEQINSQEQVRVNALAGDIDVNTVTVPAGVQVRLTANAGAITDANAAALNVSGGHLRLSAEGNISLDTAVSSLTATSGVGNLDLREADGARLQNIVAGNGDVTVTTAAGDLNVEAITAGGTADLTATAGSILDDDDDATVIEAGEILLAAGPGGSLGAAGASADLDTLATIINASGGTGGLFLTETDGVQLTGTVTGSGQMRIGSAGGRLTIAGLTSSEDGDIALDSAGDIRISGPLSSDTGDITLDANGLTDVRAGDVTTASGDITFGAVRTGAASLRSDVTATGGAVVFNRRVTVDGNARVAAGTEITFARAIDGDFALVLDGDADTDVTLAEAVGDSNPLASLTIRGRNIDARSDIETIGDIAINSNPAVAGGLPAGVITLGGDVRSGNGSIRLNATISRGEVPSVATIAADGDVTISADGDFVMGRNEKFTALGNLTIDAGGDAQVGDLTALNRLTVNADDIRLLLRDPGNVRRPGGGVEQDAGLDIIGGDGIEFSVRPVFDGTGAAPRFASTNGVDLDPVDLTGLQTFALATPVSAANLVDGAITLDGRVDGVIFEVTPVRTPKEAHRAQIEPGVGAGMMAELEDLGVFVKNLQLDQLIEFLERLVIYDDVPKEMAAVPRNLVEPNRYRVTRNRIPYRAAAAVLEAYYAAFFTSAEQPDGTIRREPKTVDIQDKINAAVADYKSTTSSAEVDPPALRQFIEETPAHAEALAYLNSIRDLFVKIQPIHASEGGGGLGLTPAEAAVSRQVILSRLELIGISREQLEMTILGVPPEIVQPATE